ncbi:extracellular solute-binding protein [Paenibacillus sepulcri]
MIRLFVLTGIFMMLLSACFYNNTADNGKTKQKEDPLEITWTAILYAPAPPSDVVISKIEEATNTELSFTWVPDAVSEDKITIALASHTLTKVVTIQDIKSTAYLNAARGGVFWEIGPYLKDFPNLSKMNPSILQDTAIDGKNYGIYRERDLSRQGIIIRKDWLEKLGLPEPETLNDLYDIFVAFKERDPDGNLIHDTFGIPDRNDLVFGIFKTLASYEGAPNSWGLKDGKLVPDFMFKEYMDTMKFMKKLYVEKLINPDFAVTSKQQQWDYFTNEHAGVYIGNMDDSKNLNSALLKVNPDAQLDLINRINGPDGKPHIWSQAGHNGVYVFPKSQVKTEEELKRILAFFDRLGDPDIYRLTQLGIEGIHYKVIGERVYENISGAAAAIEKDVRPLSSIQVTVPELLKPDNDPIRKKNILFNADNVNFIVANPVDALESVTFNEKGNELNQIIEDATYDFILGSIDEAGFQKAIAVWSEQGGDQVIDEYNDAYHAAH